VGDDIDAVCGCGFESTSLEIARDHSKDCAGEKTSVTTVDQNVVGKSDSFYIHCMCGGEFSSSNDYTAHRKTGGRRCADAPVFRNSAIGSGSAFADNVLSADKQVSAFFGDLDHKREVINKYQQLGMATSSFFDGKHMAWFVLRKFPELVDVDGPVKPSVRTLATIFEYHFHVSVAFRFAYMRWLPNELKMAPVVDANGSLPVADKAIALSSFSHSGEHVIGAGAIDDSMLFNASGEPVDRNAYSMGSLIAAAKFMLPIKQRVPASSMPPGDPNAIFGWANQEKYWRAYPELMGYDRQAAFRTSGDVYPWFFSSVARYDGDGAIHVIFPSVRSPFDGEEQNPSVGQLDGLSHWQNRSSVVGFKIACWVLSDMVTFVEDVYSGRHVVIEINAREAFADGAFISFKGTPSRRAYFIVQRFVVWKDSSPVHGPRPESPGPGEHDDL
jgi:hypothetical protein